MLCLRIVFLIQYSGSYAPVTWGRVRHLHHATRDYKERGMALSFYGAANSSRVILGVYQLAFDPQGHCNGSGNWKVAAEFTGYVGWTTFSYKE